MGLSIEPVTVSAAYCRADRVAEMEARVFFTVAEVSASLLFYSLGHTQIDRSCKHQESLSANPQIFCYTYLEMFRNSYDLVIALRLDEKWTKETDEVSHTALRELPVHLL